jgi:S1-C subfamily serine protease
VTIGWAPSASAADDERKPLVPRRLFDQARPGVELITAEFTAQLNLPEAEITATNQQALQALVTERIRRGEVPPTETAGRNAAIEELTRDPFRWYTPTSRVYREKVKLSAAGSGFSISPDGYIVTNAHVAAPTDKDLKAAFIREALSDQSDAFLQNLGQDGIPQRLAAKYLGALVRWATRTATLANLQRRLAAVTDSGTGGITYTAGRPAKLVAAGKELPGKDVAILKVEASNMATVQLGDDTALGTGDRLFVLGFPAPATFNPALSKDSQKEPTLTQGVLSAKKTLRQGFTVLQTDAAMTHGNSGGPVFDEQGRVVGVATFGSVDPSTGREVAGLNFAVPVSVVHELLSRANVTPVEGTATNKYRLALDAFDKQWYKRALPLFKDVKALDATHPSVDRFIAASQAAISHGRDQTPREFLGLPLTLLVVLAASVGLLVVGVLVAVPVRRRRRMARRRAVPGRSAVQPGPIPLSFPGASRPAPLETRAAGEQSDWLDHQSLGWSVPQTRGAPSPPMTGIRGELPGGPPRRRNPGRCPRNRPRSPRRPSTVTWRHDPTLRGSHHRGIGADTSGNQAGVPPGLPRPGPASQPAPPSGGGTAAGGSRHRSSRHQHRWCAGTAGTKARRPSASASNAGPFSDQRNSPAPAGWTRCGLGDDRDEAPRPAASPTPRREPRSSKSSIPSPVVWMERIWPCADP